MQIINPATEEVIRDVKEDDSASVEEKLANLRRGQKFWSEQSISDRLTILGNFRKLINQHKDELAQILTSETGKPITQSLNEINGSQDRIAHLMKNAERWLQPEETGLEGETLEVIYHEPLGVIANISAWNFPYNVGYNVFLYALMAGNAVLYKPSEYATLTGIRIKELLHEAGMPVDVFETIVGDGKVGQLLLESDLDGYFFTGSYQTGLHIAQAVAQKLVPVQLELGGKDPLYVMEDVEDIRQAAINAADGAFYNNGQSCCAVERIYVHEKIYQEFIEHFKSAVSGFQQGDPMDKSTYFGPLTRKEQMDVILDQIHDAQDKGAKVLLGGKEKPGKGFYMEPTILTDVTHEMKVMRAESFGPVIGIQQVENDSEAVSLMRDTDYGLTAAVFSESEGRARKILDQLDVGTAYWNCCDRVSPNVPWSGRKHSGLGVTLSYMGIRAFTQPKAYHLRG